MRLGEAQPFASPGEALTAHISEESSENPNDHRTKSGSPGEILEHYGKKGMRWGVRNEDEPVGRDSAGKVTSAPDIPNAKDRVKILTRTDRPQVLTPTKSDNGGRTQQVEKVEEQHGLTRNQKIAIGVGVAGVAAGGYIAYRHYLGTNPPGLSNIERELQSVQKLDDITLPKNWDVRGLSEHPLSKRPLGDLAGSEFAAKLSNPGSLAIDTSRGYADFVPKSGFKNPFAAEQHDSAVRVLDQMRDKYPAIRNMNIELVPMSHMPEVGDSAHMAVLPMRAGEARLLYNDMMDKPNAAIIRANRRFLPGLGAKDYVAQHEMGHLLAVAGGQLPPAFDLLKADATPAAWNTRNKAEPLMHRKMFAKHGFTFKELSKISQYAATEPAEAMAELAGHFFNPEMRSRLTPEQLVRAEAMFNEMGGVS